MQKNAPLPNNWKSRKCELLELSKIPTKRGQVFKELFEESNSTNIEVANFLSEFIVHVFPNNFLKGCNKNKKVFNQKILSFVNFNRFETFTRVTLLEKF